MPKAFEDEYKQQTKITNVTNATNDQVDRYIQNLSLDSDFNKQNMIGYQIPVYQIKVIFLHIKTLLNNLFYYFTFYYNINNMGVASKTTRASKLKNGPSKLQKQRRVARINKKVHNRTNERKLKHIKKADFVKRKNQIAQNEIIEVIEPAYHDQPQQGEVNIADLLNQTSTNSMFDNLNDQLDLKLKQIDEDNLDNPEVKRVYTAIGKILSSYRSGKIPKAFKIVPNLQKWQQILALTSPEKWTPQAMFQAVNLFASNLDADRAGIFYSTILLPAIRQNLKKNKKLNYHYFQALRKALYKPNAWFKTILFGLQTQTTTSTPRQVQIIEAVLKQNSIPMLNSAAALMLLMELPTNTNRMHLIKTLIEKQYVLGKKVVDSLYFYFLGFEDRSESLPVIWHQAVLCFCMFYGNNFGEMQKAALKELVLKHKHHVITAQIIKYL